MRESLYEGTVQSMDAATGIVTCIIPSLFGGRPQKLPPSLARGTDVSRISPVKGGDSVLCFSPGADDSPLVWLPSVRDSAFDSFNDARYVNVTGDTMSGSLVVSAGGINVTGGATIAGGVTSSGTVSVGSGGQLQLNSAGEAIRFQGGSGEYISFWNSAQSLRTGYIQANDGSGIILNSEQGPLDLRGAGSVLNLHGSSMNLGIPSGYGSSYRGFNWGGNYVIMTANGGDTFISAGSGSNVYIRGGQNNGYQLMIAANGNHTMAGHLNLGGYNLTAQDIYSNANLHVGGGHVYLTAEDGGGGGWDVYRDGYIRSAWDKWIYTGGSIVCANGFTCGRGGGGWYYERAFQANNNGARVGYSLLPGGYAVNLDELNNSPNFNILNTDSSGYADVYGGAYTNASQRRLKQDIKPWPQQARSLGAAADERTTWDKLHAIEVVSYRVRQELALRPAMGERREKALQRLNTAMAAKGAPLYPQPHHQCGSGSNSDFDCGGTADNPCIAMRNWQQEVTGVIVEDFVHLFPEAVSLDANDGSPGGINLMAAIAVLFRALQDLPPDLPDVARRLADLEARVAARG